MLQLFSLLSDVSADQGLGYGLAGKGALGLLFGIPAIGIVLGGVLAGALVVAGLLAVLLVRTQRRTRMTPSPASSESAALSNSIAD